MDTTRVVLPSRPNCGFSLNYFTFYCKNMDKNIISISFFQTGLNDFFLAQLFSILIAKL